MMLGQVPFHLGRSLGQSPLQVSPHVALGAYSRPAVVRALVRLGARFRQLLLHPRRVLAQPFQFLAGHARSIAAARCPGERELAPQHSSLLAFSFLL